MTQRLLYIVGRNADFAGIISCRNGQIILNMPNYHRVYEKPIKPQMSDEFCFCVRVPADKVKETQEREGTVLRVWDGPLNSNQYPQYKVRADVFNMSTPLAGGDIDPATLEEVQALKIEVAQLKEAVGASKVALREASSDLHKADESVEDMTRKLAAAESEIATLRDKLTQATSSTIIRGVDGKTLAKVIETASDDVLVLMPHCGPETVPHFKKWAAEELAK